jgi:hypothetical protein
MKRFLIVLILVVVFSGAAFADHPEDQWGVGVMFRWDLAWDRDFGDYSGAAFSLKVPDVPIFWGINLGFGSHYFKLGVTGDKYFIDQSLVPDINLHWYVGIGGYVNFYHVWDYFSFGFGARLPIGLSWHIDIVEVFLDVAPGLGIRISPSYGDKFNFPDGSLAFELGVRLWF